MFPPQLRTTTLPALAEQKRTGTAPPFVATLLALQADDRKAILQAQHPNYSTHVVTWQVLLDAFEGEGGFLDGSYLWPYPRESEEDFRKRRTMARYHNYLETLVDLYVRFMFTQGVNRTSKNEQYNAWLEDVDGAGTPMNDFLKQFAAMSLVNGHAGALLDKTADLPEGPTMADEKARVIASIFIATSISDWRYKGNALQAVKLLEQAPSVSIIEKEPEAADDVQYLLWDETGWARFDKDGELVDADMPLLGIVPLITLRPKPSQRSRMLGRALVSNANVVRACFNRAAEEDQVIRDQAFSVLTVSLDKDADIDQAKAHLGGIIGTAKALVVKGTIDYKTPDQSVPGTIRDNIAYLVQEMYRAAHVRIQRESLAAESGESIRLQYTELNEMLQGFSKALAQCEREIARAWFGWMFPTEQAAQAAFEAAAPEATYPSEFFLDALINDLTAWAEALALGLGASMAKRIKKRAVRRIDPTIPADELVMIDDEIDQLQDNLLSGTDGLPLDTGNPSVDAARTLDKHPPPVDPNKKKGGFGAK